MRHYLLPFLLSSFFFVACTEGRLRYPASSVDNRKLNIMLFLHPGDTIFPLAMFVQRPDMVDSVVEHSDFIRVRIDKKTSRLYVHVNEAAVGLTDLKLYIQNVPYSVPCSFSVPGSDALVELPSSDSLPRITTNKYNLKTLTLNVLNGASSAFIYWQNYRLPDNLYLLQPKQLLISVPEEATDVPRSSMRVWTCNKHGVSRELLIPLAFGKPVVDSVQFDVNDKNVDSLLIETQMNTVFDFKSKTVVSDPIRENLLHTQLRNKFTELVPGNPLYGYGQMYLLQRSELTAVYAQKYFDREMLLFINNSPKPKEFRLTLPEIFISKTFKALWGKKFDFDDKTIRMKLNPFGAEFLQRYDSN